MLRLGRVFDRLSTSLDELDHVPPVASLALAQPHRFLDGEASGTEFRLHRTVVHPAEVAAEYLGPHIERIFARQSLEITPFIDHLDDAIGDLFSSDQDVLKMSLLLGIRDGRGCNDQQRNPQKIADPLEPTLLSQAD